MSRAVRIGVVGDFDPEKPSHTATNTALAHAAAATGTEVTVSWIPTETVDAANASQVLAPLAGLWAAPASPYRSADGMLAAIRYARESGRPFIGT